MPKLIVDLTYFSVLLVGSLAGSTALIDYMPLLGFLATFFSFSYMAWQFETFGRIREFRLITNQRRPSPKRSRVITLIADTIRIALTVYALTPLPIAIPIAVGVLLVAGLILSLLSEDKLVELVDQHEQMMRPKRLAKLIDFPNHHQS